MTTVTIKRGEVVAIPFSITDAASGLVGKRVTWVVAAKPNTGARLLTKASALGSSSAAVTINTQTGALIEGTINIDNADYSALPVGAALFSSLWVDDGAASIRCATPAGVDRLVILDSVPKGG
jgi:hypothetical protein